MAEPSTDTLDYRILRMMEEAASGLQEPQIAAAVAQFEKDLRERVALVAIDLSRYYHVQHHENEIVITVKIEDRR